MAVNYTALLGLAQPVNGTEAGTWGDDVNNGLTALVDTAIAGAQTFSASATLTTTAGAANTFRQAIIIVSGSSGTVTLTAPAGKSKSYIILNESSFPVVINTGTGGVTLVAGEYATVAYDGSTNYLKVASSVINVVAVTSGTINGAVIGGTAPAAITGTTVTATSQFTGPGTGLTGTATGLSVGGNAATATTAAAATTLATANFSVVQSGGKLYFKYGATNIASLDSSGNFVALANVAGYTTP